MSKYKLTKKQLETMKTLWASTEPLTASQIAEKNPSLNLNTVRTVITFLLEHNYIQTADIVLSKKTLTRAYLPVITADEYVAENFSDIGHGIFSTALFSNFVKQEDDPMVLEKLKEILEARESELKGEKETC